MEWSNDAELFDVMRSRLYTAIVGDVLDTVGRRHQFLPARCRPLRPDLMVAGRAMTVLEEDVSAESAHPFGRMFEAIDSLRPHEIYIAAGGSPIYAQWGELMSTAARARGATGAVLAGMSRDTRAILALDFPVFSYGCYAQDQRGRGQIADHHVTLNIEGVQVRPGDIVFGDIDGVLVVPREVEEEVITGALQRARKERGALKDLAAGRASLEVFKTHGVF